MEKKEKPNKQINFRCVNTHKEIKITLKEIKCHLQKKNTNSTVVVSNENKMEEEFTKK